jgi:hypothetical protein
MSTEAKECWRCHVTSADRVVSDGSKIIEAMCFECLWSDTEIARRQIFEWTGIPFCDDAAVLPPDASDSEIQMAWERHDACCEMSGFLVAPLQAAIAGRQAFCYQWTGGRVDEPTTMSGEMLLRLRALVAAHGYDEVTCETFRNDDPTKGHQLMPEGEPPHWCTQVDFKKAS